MILERNNTRARQQEDDYRRQLYNAIQQRQQQKDIQNKSKIYYQKPKEEFSLITNIESEQQKRKNKQKQYYEELERQRQEAIQLKKRKRVQDRQQQDKVDMKIKMENQSLRKRYDQQIRNQNRKKQTALQNAKIQSPPPPKQRKFHRRDIASKQKEERQNTQNYPKDSIDNLEQQGRNLSRVNSVDINQDWNGNSQAQTYQYMSRVENQQFNFPPRRVINNSYYKELLAERRKFDEQTNSLRDLNRMIQSQYLHRNHTNFEDKSKPINDLREMSKLLDEQSQSYMKNVGKSNNRSSYNTLKSTNYNLKIDPDYYQF